VFHNKEEVMTIFTSLTDDAVRNLARTDPRARDELSRRGIRYSVEQIKKNNEHRRQLRISRSDR